MVLEDLHTELEKLCAEKTTAGVSISKLQGERWVVSILATGDGKHMGLGDGDTMAEAIEQAIADYRREDV